MITIDKNGESSILGIHSTKKIVFFDGVCNLCNSSVNHIIQYNTSKNIYFCTLQSSIAKELLKEFGRDSSKLTSVFFYDRGNLYHKSKAVLEISKNLDGKIPRLTKFFQFLPKIVADLFYSLIAFSRYSIFGKQTSCRIPSDQEKDRFLC